MIHQKVKCTLDEMVEILEEMPMDIIESCILPVDKLGMQDWPMDSPLYSENGLLVHISMLDNDELNYLLSHQADKDFFIPSEKILDEICRSGYEVSALAYKRLESFFTKKIGLDYEQAVTWCLQVWANSYEGNSPADIINCMTEEKINFNSDKILNEFVELLMNAHNSTRLKENRGHKPDEMGFPIDIDGGADTIQTSFYPDGLNGQAVKTEKKIYPNDLCPCGAVPARI